MSKCEELLISYCLTLKTSTALWNQLYEDTQATSAYSFSRLVLLHEHRRRRPVLLMGFLLPQVLLQRDWTQAGKKSLQGWTDGAERKNVALDTYIIESRQM